MEYWQGFGSDGLESLMMFSFSNSDDFVSKITNSSNSNWYDVWTVCISCKYDKNIFTGEVMTATFQFQWRIMLQLHLEVLQESLHPVLNSQLVQMRNLVIKREITTLFYYVHHLPNGYHPYRNKISFADKCQKRCEDKSGRPDRTSCSGMTSYLAQLCPQQESQQENGDSSMNLDNCTIVLTDSLL